MSKLTRLHDDNFADVLRTAGANASAGERVAVVKFTAPWCPPCVPMGVVVEQIASERKDIVFFEVDADESPETAARFSVRALPTVLLFVNGDVAAQIVGAQSKPAFASWLDAQLSRARATQAQQAQQAQQPKQSATAASR